MRNGKLLIAESNWIEHLSARLVVKFHYFRPNGTLAKIYNQYFESDYHTVQETIYDTEGKVLRVRTRCVDTGGRGPHKFVKCQANLPPQINDPVYRKVEELPLNELLRSE